MSTLPDTPRLLYLDGPGAGRARLREALEAAGYGVTVVAEAHDARAQLEERAFALVLADAAAGGRGLVDAVDPRCGPPVVLLDAFGTAEDAHADAARGVRATLARPLPEARVVEAVERTLAAVRRDEEQAGTERFGELVTSDPRMREAFRLARAVVDTRVTVLIQGESGTGKTRLARALHRASERRAAPFVEVNCGALPGQLLESELFGHARGSFTGADRDRAGKFEAAEGGTLFLDEIACATPDLQVKLLRVLESRRFERVGDNTTREADVRVVAACNRDLADEVAAGRFREDLRWRLDVVRLELPPLRERLADVPPLAAELLRRVAARHGRTVAPLGTPALAVLLAHDWPGNVRELEHALERAVLLAGGPHLDPEDFGALFRARGDRPVAPGGDLDLLAAWLASPVGPLKAALELPERLHVERALRATGGARRAAAELLGINRSTLFNKMRQHGLLGSAASSPEGPRGTHAR